MSDEPSLPAERFLITKEYRRFAEFCDACRREKYIGLCHGPPGVGKTLSARHYASWDILEKVLPTYVLFGGEPMFAAQDCRTIFYTPTVTNTPRQLTRDLGQLQERLRFLVEDCHAATEQRERNYQAPERAELIIIDEADRLRLTGLEQLRDLYDRGSFGLVLIGMPGLEKRLSRYKQLYSRVGFVHEFRPLSKDEMYFTLSTKWRQLGLALDLTNFMDVEAVGTIIRITGGNFRLMHRLFSQIQRILEINQLQTVSKEVVEAAREGLILGS